MVTVATHCRLCGSGAMKSLFALPAPLVSCFPSRETAVLSPPPPLLSVSLDVLECCACALVQLGSSVAPSYLYQDYWYESGVNEQMRRELRSITEAAESMVELLEGDSVLDIGANDGTLLKCYGKGLHLVAVEPAQTFLGRLAAFCDATITGTFPECAPQIPIFHYKIITSIAMFYDLDNPVAAAQEIRRLLHPYGVWVCQFQDLGQQVEQGVWDNFVHEHVAYYTLTTFREVCRRAGLEVVRVERTPINGGSLRVFVQHHGAGTPDPAIQDQCRSELGVVGPGWHVDFLHRVQHNASQIRYFVEQAAKHGPVDLYGASTKGNTLLQVTGVSPLIRHAWERNARKFGRTTVTGVPIIDEAVGRVDPPVALLATIWQFKSQILQRERLTLQTTPMILPLPDATWVAVGDYQ